MKSKYTIYLLSAAIASLLFLQSCTVLDMGAGKDYKKALETKVVYDAIIVPGVPFDVEEGKWGLIMKARVYWAAHLYKNGHTKNIIFSGSAVYTPFVESHIMAMYGEKLGIDPAHIYMESDAEHSTENVYYSYHLAKDLGFEKIALATDPVQTSMVKSFREKMNLDIGSIPVVFSMIDKMDTYDPEIDYEKAYVANFESIKAREGFFERFKGTQGKKIEERTTSLN